MSMRVVAVAFGLMVVVGAALMPAWAAEGPPVVFWYSDPVKPGEIAMIQGDRFPEEAEVEFLRLGDGEAGQPQAAPAAPSGATTLLTPLQGSLNSVKFEIPPKLSLGIYAARVKAGAGESGWVFLNAPQPWWQQGDWGAEAAPGGWLRIFGRCLSFNDQAVAVLRAAGKPPVAVKPSQQDCWSLRLDLPSTLPAAEYEVWIHNGYGGKLGWRSSGTMRIAPQEPFWKTDRFDITAYGAIPDDERDDTVAVGKALAAAEVNGGGIVFVPRGRFNLTDGLSVPKHVLLQGAGQELSLLEWQDMSQAPDALIAGLDNFSVQDLSLYAINHRIAISSADAQHGGGEGNIWIRHVRIRLNRTLNVPADVAAKRRALPTSPLMEVGGANLQITDCDMYSDGSGLYLSPGPNSVVARNQVLTPAGGWSYGGGGPNLIYEDNYFLGATVNQGGVHEYCARNRIRHQYSGYREMMVTDTGGGNYVGKVASCEGTKVVLADKMDWRGRYGFSILSGTGVGQWRRIEKVEGQTLTLDRPLEVVPDETSIVAVTVLLAQVLWIENDNQDGADAVTTYGTAYDCVIAGNTCARSTGYEILGFNYNGPAPNMYVQLLNNEITQGYGMKGPGANDGWTWIRVRSGDMAQVRGTEFVYRGPMVRGTVVRGNVLGSNGNIALLGSPADTVIDHNVVREAQFGVTVSGGASGVVLWRNQLEAVDRPVSPAVNQALAHPADLALAGMNTAERYLSQAPPGAWKEIRQRLTSLQQESPTSTHTILGVQACLKDAGRALAGLPGPLPANLVRSLFSLDITSNPWAMPGYIDKNTGQDQNLDLYASAAAWAPPLELTTELTAPETWRVTDPGAQALKPGGSALRFRLALNIPADTWGVYRVPLVYTVKGADWELKATENLTLGTGPVKDWAVVGPFVNESKEALDRAVHPPERRQDLSAEYDTPAGKRKWQPVTSPDGTVKLKDLLGEGTRQVAYAIGVVRAARETPVSLSATNGASGLAVYLNRQLVLETQRGGERRGSVVLQPGDNVIFVMISSLGADWSFSVRLDPLEPTAPGELTVVPAAELETVPALRPTTEQVPEGASLPFAQGQNWRLVFHDDFSWPRLGLDWELLEGTWKLVPGAIRATDGMATMAYRGKVLPPARVEYELRPLQDNYRRVMGVGYTPAGQATGRWLWGVTKGAGYFLTFGWHDDKANHLWRQEKSVVVSKDPPYPETGKWHHIIVQFVPPKAQMYVDGKLALEYSDPEWLPELDTVSFYDWPPPAELRNIRIYTAARP